MVDVTAQVMPGTADSLRAGALRPHGGTSAAPRPGAPGYFGAAEGSS